MPGIALMVLHITGYLTGWALLLYVFLILVGMGMENKENERTLGRKVSSKDC